MPPVTRRPDSPVVCKHVPQVGSMASHRFSNGVLGNRLRVCASRRICGVIHGINRDPHKNIGGFPLLLFCFRLELTSYSSTERPTDLASCRSAQILAHSLSSDRQKLFRSIFERAP